MSEASSASFSSRDLESRIDRTVSELQLLVDPEIGVVLAGHCTGWRAKAALADGLAQGRSQPLSVGGKYVFQGRKRQA